MMVTVESTGCREESRKESCDHSKQRFRNVTGGLVLHSIEILENCVPWPSSPAHPHRPLQPSQTPVPLKMHDYVVVISHEHSSAPVPNSRRGRLQYSRFVSPIHRLYPFGCRSERPILPIHSPGNPNFKASHLTQWSDTSPNDE